MTDLRKTNYWRKLLAVAVIRLRLRKRSSRADQSRPGSVGEIRFSYDMPNRPIRMDRVGLSTRFRSMCS